VVSGVAHGGVDHVDGTPLIARESGVEVVGDVKGVGDGVGCKVEVGVLDRAGRADAEQGRGLLAPAELRGVAGGGVAGKRRCANQLLFVTVG